MKKKIAIIENAIVYRVHKYQNDPSNGSIINSFPSPSSAPYGLAYFDQYLWHTDKKEDKIYKLCFQNELFLDNNIISTASVKDDNILKAEVQKDNTDKLPPPSRRRQIEDENFYTIKEDNDFPGEENEREDVFDSSQDNLAIKWEDNIIKVEGLAFFRGDMDDRLREGRQAIKEAEDNAYKRLFEVINKIKLDAERSISDYIKSDVTFRRKIQKFVKNATVVDKRYLEMGARVILKVKLNGPDSLGSIIGKRIRP